MKVVQLVLSVIITCSTLNVEGAIRYVSEVSGNDIGDGTTASAPVKTIQYAIDNADNGDDIHIATYEVTLIPLITNSCTYTDSGTAVINIPNGKSFNLKGGYIYIKTTGAWQAGIVPALVDAKDARRCLYSSMDDGDTNHLELLEFTSGAATDGANIYAQKGSLQLVGCPIHDGTATGNGGGVYMLDVDFSASLGSYSNLALPQMTGLLPIYNNSATSGGGLYLDGGYPLLTTVGVMDNVASANGGGIYIDGGIPSVVGGAIQNNTASGNGGAIYLTNSVARVGGMLITSNTAVYGGGIYLDGPFALSLETATLIANNYIRYNEATGGKGGGIFFNEANVGVVNNVIANNIATNGAASYLHGSSPRFLENTIADNTGDTGLYMKHTSGEGRWIVVETWVGTYSNYVEGIPLPCQPTFTNSIISGHSTAIYVEDSGSSILPNKVDMGYTLWWKNSTADISGPGTVIHNNDLYDDPLYTGKGMQPNDMTPYHIETNSPAVDSGTSVGLSLPGTDLLLDIDGQMRPSGGGMDIGADEVVTDPFSVWFVPVAISHTALPGTSITNEHMLLNSGTQNDTYKIDADDSVWSSTITPAFVALDAQSSTSITVVIQIPAGALNGDTNITTITATSQTDNNKTAVAVDTTGISTNNGPAVRYVWQDSPTPQSPYTTPDTAGHELQTVVDVCQEDDTVLVYPGIYETGGAAVPGLSITNRIYVTNSITVQSTSGPDETIIMGQANPITTNGPAAIRGAYLTGDAKLFGFTIMDGHTHTNNSDESRAGGIYMYNGATISNCTITACSSDNMGGGIFGQDSAYIFDSIITENYGKSFGGGVTLYDQGFINNSKINNNFSLSSGGGIALLQLAFAEQCTISSNRSDDIGGGIFIGENSIVQQCLIKDNSAYTGGGARCNTAGKVENSLFIGNQADNSGGGLFIERGSILNCTISDNSAPTCGGIYFRKGADIINTIAYYNNNDNWFLHTLLTNSPTWNNCCTTPAPSNGIDNITDAPLFVDAPSGDYRIIISSPCTDTGTNIILTTNKDLNGNHRPMDGNADGTSILDIGCYEVSNANGDSDEDGMNDGDEAIADTNPFDENDYFHIKAVSNNTGTTVFFDSSLNRTYTMMGRQDLSTGNWSNVTGGGPRQGTGENDFMVDTNSPARFHIIKVEQ